MAAAVVTTSRRIEDTAIALPGGRSAREAAAASAAWRTTERELAARLGRQAIDVHRAADGYEAVEAGTTSTLREAR